MKRIGKIGKANLKARKKIAEIARELNIDRCELCGGTFGVAPAHWNNREWYKGDWKKLSDYRQWIVLCQKCHSKMDDRSQTTREEVNNIFKKLR